MSVFFIGDMPWVQLFESGRRTGWASVVRADWSPHGPGRLVNLWRADRWQITGDNEALASWLTEWYLVPNPELNHGTDRPPIFRSDKVALDIDLDSGLRASAGGVQIEITGPLDRQLVRREQYPLGEFTPTCSWVRIPCERGTIVVDGEPILGAPSRSTDSYGQSSTAQINVAEVWTT